VALQSGANVITVTARDAAGNTSAATLTVTYTPPDVTAPTSTITTPTTATTYSTASTPLAIGGTASDAVGVTQVSWANDRGGSGTATGTTAWTASVALQSGANVITVTARDAAGNTSVATLTVTYTVTTPRRALNDFDGDGSSDIATWGPGTGMWRLLNSSSNYALASQLSISWGQGALGDVPVPGDYDGDGKTDLALWRPGTGDWSILKSSTNDTASMHANWGGSAWGDIPVSGDYDGDGRTDIAIWRPGTGAWWILESNANYTTWMHAVRGDAAAGDVPVPGDYDGDGKTDLAIWRPGTGDWWILTSSTDYTAWVHVVCGDGALGDIPVPGDYDGDGKTDVAIWRPGTGDWWILKSSADYATWIPANLGGSAWGDIPVPGDYDGDGKTDLAIWRPGTGDWWVLTSSTDYAMSSALHVQSGGPQDVPIGGRSTGVATNGFGKSSPSIGATGLGSEVTLTWPAVSGATYRVCVDTINNGVCDNSWRQAMTWTSISYAGLAAGTYYWQVVADTGSGSKPADGGMWWSFTVGGGSPALAPTVTGVSPSSGPTSGGTPVTITGTNFQSGATVIVGGTAATSVSVTSATQIQATTPARSAGSVTVTVTNPNGSPGSLASAFTYVSSGASGSGGGWGKSSPVDGASGLGSEVNLAWAAVSGATYQVCVDTTNNGVCDTGWRRAMTWTSISYAGLAAGTYYWQVLADTGSGSTAADGGTWWSFTVGGGSSVPTPTVTGVSPSSGPTSGGTPVTISGTNFQSGATVIVGGTAATSVSVTSATQLQATTPARSAGSVTVTVTNPNGSPGSLASAFTYVSSGGSSSGGGWGKSSPADGASGLGSEVNLAWAAVSGATYQVCVDTVNNGVCDTGWRRAMTWTSISYAGLAAGPYYWQVLADTGSGSTAADGGTWWSFTVGGGSSVPTPTVTGVSPSSGPTSGGTPVTISGTNFQSGATVIVGGTAATSVSVTSATQIQATTPARSAGAVTVTVTNPGGSPGSLGSAFTYVSSGGSGGGGSGKLSPADGASGPGSEVNLAWAAVSGATFRVCVDTTNNGVCDNGWRPAMAWTSISYAGLAPGTYYWQVVADTNSGAVLADGGTWWSFTVGASGEVSGAVALPDTEAAPPPARKP
jgi:hypothetical protein